VTNYPADWWTPALYEEVGNNRNAWLVWADTLWEAAKLLRPASQPSKLPDGTELMVSTAAVYAMLLGYTLECTLKGLWVKQGHKIVEGGRYIDVPGVGSHRLLELAKAVGVTATEQEFDAVNRLSAFVRFAGRYPVSIHANEMRPRAVAGREGSTVPGFYSSEDFATVERVRNRLMTSLRFDKSATGSS
jgi:hypothetical protein